MCIGIPMKIIETGEFLAQGQGRDGISQINVCLLGPQPVGAWVLVHMGSAVRELDEEEADQINEALDALAAAMRGDPLDGFFSDLEHPDPDEPPSGVTH